MDKNISFFKNIRTRVEEAWKCEKNYNYKKEFIIRKKKIRLFGQETHGRLIKKCWIALHDD